MKELLHDDDVRRDAIAEGMANGIAKGRIEGLAEGISEERVSTIQKMLAKGFAMDVIQSLDYSEEEIQEAQAAMLTTP